MKIDDIFANVHVDRVVLSAANTLTEKQINTNMSARDRRAWAIDRVEFELPGFDSGVPVAADAQAICLSSVQDDTVMPAIEDNGLIAKYTNQVMFSGNGAFKDDLIHTYDFKTPLVVLADRLSVYYQTVGFAAAATAYIRIMYRWVTLSQSELIEIIETWR